MPESTGYAIADSQPARTAAAEGDYGISAAMIGGVLAAFLFGLGLTILCSVHVDKHCRISIESRINPNFAPDVSLVRLPGIGPARACAIVAYRENFQAADKRKLPFEGTDDLCNVQGIGPAISEGIKKWLKFERQ